MTAKRVQAPPLPPPRRCILAWRVFSHTSRTILGAFSDTSPFQQPPLCIRQDACLNNPHSVFRHKACLNNPHGAFRQKACLNTPHCVFRQNACLNKPHGVFRQKACLDNPPRCISAERVFKQPPLCISAECAGLAQPQGPLGGGGVATCPRALHRLRLNSL